MNEIPKEKPTYYQLNRDARLAYARKYNEKNKISINQKSIEYSEKHREKRRAYSKVYNEKNREKINAAARARYVAIKAAKAEL